MNKLGWIQTRVNLREPNEAVGVDSHPSPLTQDPLAEFQTFAMNSVLDFKHFYLK